jgi:hypothetical protein
MPDRYTPPPPVRLTFRLPAALGFAVPVGHHVPCLMGCLITIHLGGLVTVDGPSRERVFEQTARFLRLITRRNPPPPISIAAALRGRHSDSWQIVIGADISFVPTGMEVQFTSGAA